MEPSSSPQRMSFPEKLRPKQREIIEAFETRNEVIAKLPTGYGKTLAAAGSYAMLRHRGVCNRMLYIVPRSSQARQAAEDVPAELKAFGVDSKSIELKDQLHAIKAHRSGAIEIFVSTIQAIQASQSTSNTLASLMQTGRWFVVIDEHHHYGDEGAWSERIRALQSTALLAMSATPNRRDGTDHFAEPQISETYKSSADLKFVKKLNLHAYEYTVDAITIDGRSIPFTTDQIVAEAGESPEAIDRYIASRKMRWSPKYISPLITYPLDRLIDLRTRNVRTQMIVQALSCTHASMVCEQIKALLPDGLTVDWVGTGPSGRADKENESVLRTFCPAKDAVTGRRHWILDVLVNVGMASEGLDTTDVTEVVFLTPANITTSNLQTIGRGSRIISGLTSQPLCHVNVDTGSPMTEFVGAKIMGVFDDAASNDEEPAEERDQSANQEDDYEPLAETMQVIIVDVRLSDIRKGALWEEALRGSKAVASDATPPEVMERAAENALLKFLNRGNNLSSVLAQKRDQIDHAVSKVAGLMLRRIGATGVRVEKSLVGDLRRRINSQKKRKFGSVDDASEESLQAQWMWLRELERQILLGHALQGVPTWLR